MVKARCPVCEAEIKDTRAAKAKHRQRKCKNAFQDEFKKKGRPALPEETRLKNAKERERKKTKRRQAARWWQGLRAKLNRLAVREIRFLCARLRKEPYTPAPERPAQVSKTLAYMASEVYESQPGSDAESSETDSEVTEEFMEAYGDQPLENMTIAD